MLRKTRCLAKIVLFLGPLGIAYGGPPDHGSSASLERAASPNGSRGTTRLDEGQPLSFFQRETFPNLGGAYGSSSLVPTRRSPREVYPTGLSSSRVSAGPFVILGARSPQQASRIAQELQTTWDQMAQLADRWTQAHRSPQFPAREITVVMGEFRTHQRAGLPGAEFPRQSTSEPLVWLLDQQPPTLLVCSPAPGIGEEARSFRELKRQTVIAFLTYLPNGPNMPLWVRQGLADYIVDPPSETPWPNQMPPEAPLLKDVEWGRSAPEHREISKETYDSARLWIRYLLEGRDAQYAPEFVEAMGASNPRTRLESFLRQIVAESGSTRAWNPQFGQPLVRTLPETMPLGEPEQKLIFLLKLSWRFPAESSRLVQPRIIEHGQDRSLQMAWTAERTSPMTLDSLQQRVLDPTRPRWATLDWHGHLVFSEDIAWWQTWFQQLHDQCEVVQKDGTVLFQLKHPEGGVLEGWLEKNPLDPGRPITCLKRISS